MKKIFTLFAGFLVCTTMMAQKPEAVFTKLGDTAPVLDGVIDEVWDLATKYDVDKDYTGETPTVGESYFKAMWADSGIFVVVMVNDDVHYPESQIAADMTDTWTYDKVEIYFDVNDGNLEDSKGPGAGSGSFEGHHQFAAGINETNSDGELLSATNDGGTPYMYAQKVTNPTYVIEYFIPMSSLVDENGFVMVQTTEFGFDVNISDRDQSDADGGSRNRKLWSNIGAIAENWTNMNDAGLATLDGAEDLVYVDEITLSADATTIDTNNGQLQLSATIVPEDATNKNLVWSAEPANAVKISKTGLVTAVRDGEVTITAESTDGGYIDDTYLITISNQILTVSEVNIIRNGNFDDINAETTAPAEWGGWVDGGWGEAFATEDGAAKLVSTPVEANSADAWHYQFNQANIPGEADESYELKFKAWASEARALNFDFEDTEGNGYLRYGTSADANAVDGGSEWNVDLTTEPQWFMQTVIFDKMVESTIQKLTFMLSRAGGTVYLDSISLVKAADLELVNPIGKTRANSYMNIYPNPAGNSDVLNVRLKTFNTKVSIIDIFGRELMTQVSDSDVARFNIANLNKGIYFIRLADGSSRSFIK